ncbi:uncharacterized protein C1orf112 homolog [Hydractinia symbiolongicarpus]|uniref:uncharacterized protein C1orf112 homolog n=1 Tax=Hydractinia symbiolongicarpus TaxID=13093 RepID=UPI00254F24DC|nr:uncharacterized protein C1orf112 homolog [Hydractinia symbiolongicarpus]
MANECKQMLSSIKEQLEKMKIKGCDEKVMDNIFIQMVTIQSSLIPTSSKSLDIDIEIELRTSLMQSISDSLQILKISLQKSWNDLDSCLDCVLNAILHCFTFCRSSSESISTEYSHHANELSNLFKLTYQCMKSGIELLESHPINCDNKDGMKMLAQTLTTLINCSTELLSIDIMAAVAIWKYLKRVCSQNTAMILSNIDMFAPLFDIISITKATLSQCLDALPKIENSSFTKFQKVIRFFLGVTIQLIKDFKSVMLLESTRTLFELISDMHRLTLVENKKYFNELGCGKEYMNLGKNILTYLETLLSEFLQLPHCLMCLNDMDDFTCDVEKKNHLLLLLSILDKLSDADEVVKKKWMECDPMQHKSDTFEHDSILDLIFDQSQSCAESLFLCRKPDILLNGKPMELSLYEYMLGKICVFCSVLPATCFGSLEACLMDSLLRDSKYCRMLAMDVWCFVSRWGSSELCWSHLKLLSNLLIDLNKPSVERLVICSVSQLFKRLFWFLEEEYHMKFLDEFPVCEETIHVWGLIPLCQLQTSKGVELCSEIIQTVTSMLRETNEESDRLIVNGLSTVCSVIQNQEIYNNIDQSVKEALNKETIDFWLCFSKVDCDVEMSENLMVRMLEMTSHLVTNFDSQSISELLSVLENVVTCAESATFQLETSHFLSQLKYLQFAEDMEEQCLTSIANIFQHLLNSNDWLVEDSAMTSLREYAEVTIYSASLATFLPANKKKEFARFLKKLPHETDLNDEKLSKQVFYEVTIQKNVVETEEEESCEAKRRKIDDEVDEATDVEVLLSKVEEAVSKLSKLPKNSRLLATCKHRLQKIVKCLQELIRGEDTLL